MRSPGTSARGSLEGRTAIVTGASRGIGHAIAAELHAHGANVCITARNLEQLLQAVDRLGESDRAMAVAGSSHDPAHRVDCVAQVVERFGAVDLLVNNAATNPHYGPMVEADLAAVDKVLEVNLVAPLGWIQEVWHAGGMSERGGAILNMASVGGLWPGGLIGAYNVGKAALIHLTKQLAAELAPTVRVNAVAPALVKTQFARGLYEGREDKIAASYPLGRLGVPEDVAPIARMLLTDEAGWITGETVLLDGGLTLAGPSGN